MVDEAYADSENPDQTVHSQSAQCLHCPFTKPFSSLGYPIYAK